MALQVGDIVEGKVTGIKPFGAFVSLPEGKTGLVHISEVSYEFVQDLSAVLSDGQTVSVKVLSIAPDGKIALSNKRTQPATERAPRQPHGARSGNGGERRSRPAGERRPRLEDPPAIGGPVRREQAETAPKSEKSAVEQEILSANTGKRYGKIDI